MMALLVHFGFDRTGAWPAYANIYNDIQVFKARVLTGSRHPVPGLQTYPCTPSDLPAELFTQAFPDATDSPVSVEVTNLVNIAMQPVSTSSLMDVTCVCGRLHGEWVS